MKPKRLGHVAICVQDIPKAVQFYQNLGMEVAWQDADWAYLKAGDDGLALLSPGYEQAGPHFGFVFSDRAEVDTAYDRLKAEGIHVTPSMSIATAPPPFMVATSTATGLNTFTSPPR
jgi:catechol 2,3-dioxygenase-like lactoylglutathione lyase family enzyme